MGKEADRTKVRDNFIEEIKAALEERLDTFVLIAGSGVLAFPSVDEEGNEFYYKVQISIPRGKRDGNGSFIPWNPEKEAEEYQLTLEVKAAEAQARKEKKEKEAAEKERKKEEKRKAAEAKKLSKKLTTKGLKGVIEEGV